MTTSSYFRRFGACLAVLTGLGLASCTSDSDDSEPTVAQTIFVVSDGTPQSELLTEIYAQSLEKGGFRVSRRDPVADLDAGYALLKAGTVDLFVAHTGELLDYLAAHEPAAASTSTTGAPTTTVFDATSTTGASDSTESTTRGTTEGTTRGLRANPNSATTTTEAQPVETLNSSDIPTDETATTVFDPTATTVPAPGTAAAESINGQSNLIGQILPDTLQIGTASDAEDKSVIACNAAISTAGALVTLSDVARGAGNLTLAAAKDFETTDATFGLAGFEKVYGDVSFKEIKVLEDAKIGESISSPTTTIDTSVSTTVAPTTTEAATTTVVGPAPTTTPAATTTTTIPADLLPDSDCSATNSLDINLPNDAVIMDDDKNWIETNGVIPVLTASAFTPGVQPLIDQVSQGLTTNDLRLMLSTMNKEPSSPAAMASRYISAKSSSGS